MLLSMDSTSVSSLITLSISDISALVSIKLTETNYLLWQSQIKPLLIAQKYWRFIDGSHPCPSKFLSNADSSTITLNPAYTTWCRMDQTLARMINATLSEQVHSQVVGLSTSRQIWDCLHQNFFRKTLANATQLRFQLLSISKGTKTISEYLYQAKSLADALAAINEPVSNEDLVTFVLRGVDPDYSMLVTMIINFPPLPVFSDLRARLLSFESQITHSVLSDTSVSTAKLHQTTLLSSHGHGNHYRGSRTHRHGYGGHSDSTSSYQSGQGGRGSRNRGRNQPSTGILGHHSYSNALSIQCQICSNYGHSAVTCHQRYRNDLPFLYILLVGKIPNQGITD